MGNFVIGLDLGQSQEYTAIALLERVAAKKPQTKPIYHLRGLERLALGTPYPGIVERVRELMSDDFLCKNWRAYLVADATRVGPPVIDLLRQAGLRPVAVTITVGDQETHEGSNYRVPKRDLATKVKVLLQTDRLQIAEGLALRPILAEELPNFGVNSNPQMLDASYEAWREGENDDLVLAVALACWQADRTHWGPRVRSMRYTMRRTW